MWPSGKDMGRRVEGLKFESRQNLFPFASFLFFLFLFVYFSFQLLQFFFVSLYCLKFLDLQIFFSIALSCRFPEQQGPGADPAGVVLHVKPSL